MAGLSITTTSGDGGIDVIIAVARKLCGSDLVVAVTADERLTWAWST